MSNKFLWLLLCSFLALAVEGKSQKQPSDQQRAIQELASRRVEVFTKYLSLLGKEQEGDKIKTYEKYIKLSFIDQEDPVRVYNDLLPVSVVEKNPILDRYMMLDDYLRQIQVNYSRSLGLAFKNFTARGIYYSDYLKRYFTIVTAEREIKGIYRNGNNLMENEEVSNIDFFVQLYMDDSKALVGGVFGFEPHEERLSLLEINQEDPFNSALQAVKLYQDPLKLNSSKKKVRVKRGKTHVLRWTGGVKDDIIEVELIPLNDRVRDTLRFEPTRNKNSAQVFIDEGAKSGLYALRVTNISTGRYTQAGYLKIRR